jgi:hypothetical protein
VPVLVSASGVFSGRQSSVGASLQWEPVFSGASLQWSESSKFSVRASLQGGASLQWVLLKIQEKDSKLNIIVYSINQDIKRCFNIF